MRASTNRPEQRDSMVVPLPVEPEVPDFRFTWSGAVVNFSICHEAAANPAAESHVKYGVQTLSSAMTSFTQRRHVCIVVDSCWNTGNLTEPCPQLKIGPTLDLMGTADLADVPIDWPSKTDTNSGDVGLCQQRRQCLFDLLPDALRP